MKDIRVVSMIQTRNRIVGLGKEGDPVRVVEQYWDMEGNLRFEYDTWTKQATYHVEPVRDEQSASQ